MPSVDLWPVVIDPRFPWIRGAYSSTRSWPWRVTDTRTGEVAIVRTPLELQSFVAAHSATQGHMGLGDVARAITRRLGFGECAPCAKRQAALNAAAPRMFRRR